MACVLLILDASGLAALPIARRIASSAGHQLVVVCASKDAESVFAEVATSTPRVSELAQECRAAFESSGSAAPALNECRGPNLRRAVLDALAELGARRLILPTSLDEKADASKSLVRALAKSAPVDVLVVDPGGSGDDPVRVVIPQIQGGGAHAIRLAGHTFAAQGVMTLVLGSKDAASRSRRVFDRSVERLPVQARGCVKQSIPDSGLERALGESILPGDLVLIDVDEPSRVSSLVSMLAQVRKAKRDVPFGVAIVRPEFAAGPGRVERAYERFRSHVPKLTREERRHVHETLERGGRISMDFVVMLMLSASIASFGLIQSSAATVIGAMLVAPLMTPLLAIAMSLVQGNIRLFSHAWRALGIGIVGALLASVVIGLISPWKDLSAEIVARGGPNPFDLGTALLSGMAAAFALARSGLAGTLVGVAIAVALVPPLAVIGISTVKTEFGVAFGASVLFITNLLAIIVGAFLVFRAFGLDGSGKSRRSPRWVFATLAVVAIAMAPTTGVLLTNLQAQREQGVHRPYARPLPPSIREQIVDRVARHPAIEIVFMAESEIEHGFGREVALMSEFDFDPALVADLRAILAQGVKGDIPVRVLLLRGAPSTP